VTKRIGILGGGQLGLLLAQSLVRLGCAVSIYEPDPEAPACKQTNRASNGSFTDQEKLERFFAECDLVTYEFENVESELLFQLQRKKALLPSAEILSITQNRGHEKSFMRKCGLPYPQFCVVETGASLEDALADFGLPCIAKTTSGGYDGKGQFLLESVTDAQALCDVLKKSPVEIILEEKIELDIEVSCIVGRSQNGEQVVFPVFENRHRHHILDLTLLPATAPLRVLDKVMELAARAAHELKVIGLLTVEFFLTRTAPQSRSAVEIDGFYILINEFAPRPHNSGHITMKACDLSQFDILARILADVPLRQPVMVGKDNYCMGNLLGDLWLSQNASARAAFEGLDLSALVDFPEVVDVVIYGKTEARPKRKMGHFIAASDSLVHLIEVADKFRARLSVPRDALSAEIVGGLKSNE